MEQEIEPREQEEAADKKNPRIELLKSGTCLMFFKGKKKKRQFHAVSLTRHDKTKNKGASCCRIAQLAVFQSLTRFEV